MKKQLSSGNITQAVVEANESEAAHETVIDEPLDFISLDKLESMDKTALRAILERICAARWGEIALMDKTAVAEAMKLRLAHIALTAEVKDALIAIERWLDRQEGKPMQNVTQEITVAAKPFTPEEERQMRQALYQYALTHGEG